MRLKVIISCLSLLCSLCTFSVKTSYALGWDDIGGCAVLACVPSVVKGAVNDTADHLTGDAKKLYLEVMNDFVSTKLPAMLSQFDMLASKHELKLNEMLDKIKAISDSLIQEINAGIRDINTLVENAFKKADAFVDKVACDVEGTVANAAIDVQNGVQTILNSYVPRWFRRKDQCQVRFGTPNVGEHAKVISLRDCELGLRLRNQTPMC